MSDLPTVLSPTYESFSSPTEKGYIVDFELSHDRMKAKSVVINRIEHQVQPEEKKGLLYHLRILAESRTLFGFKAKTVDRENGILFQGDSTEVFKPVEFKLKDH